MSVVDTLVGGGLALLGVSITYLAEERRSKREIRLRSFADRQVALDEVFGALTECFFKVRDGIIIIPKTAEEFNERVSAPIWECRKQVYRRILWISTSWQPVADALAIFGDLGMKIGLRMPGGVEQNASQKTIQGDLKMLQDAYGRAGNAIGRSMGIPPMEHELQDLIEAPEIKAPSQP